MNAKTIVRVLFVVLAALALTVLVASAQNEPAAPDKSAAITELGESASPAADFEEIEWNGSFNQATLVPVGSVVGGKIRAADDVDYYRVDITIDTNVIIDVDAQSIGSPLDASICLYDRSKTLVGCNDDAYGLDPLLFRIMHDPYWGDGGTYFITVGGVNYPPEGGNEFTYKLALYQPLLISATVNGVVGGVPFQKSDILAHYDFADGTEKWMLFFDASDVDITKNVVGLAGSHTCCTDINLVLQANQNLTVYGASQTVTPYDVLTFDPGPYGHFGPTTVGEFPYFDYRGNEYGLTLAAEKIDALAVPWWVSTVGKTTFASGETVADEDISNLGYGDLYFDGSLVPGLAVEDVFAADYSWGTYYLTILGNGEIDGLKVTQKDIFAVNPSSMRLTGLVWHGPDHGFNYPIDAFDLGTWGWGG